MSTCITPSGGIQYSEHLLTNDAQPYLCQRCFWFDEEGAMDEILASRAERAEIAKICKQLPGMGTGKVRKILEARR